MNDSTYSQLQVVEQENIPSGLEYYQQKRPLSNNSSVLPPDQPRNQVETTVSRRLCGLPIPIFWIVAAVFWTVVVGAIVGSVVGTLSKKNSSTEASGQFEASNSSSSSTNQPTATVSAQISTTSSLMTPSASLASSVALTTTAVIGPSETLLSDCPSSNNTLYQIGSATFRKSCGRSLVNSINGGNAVNSPTKTLDDCITLCNAYNIQNTSEIAAGQSNICNAVCWRGTIVNDDFPGECFGFTTQNSSDSFVWVDDTACNSAGWINQSF